MQRKLISYSKGALAGSPRWPSYTCSPNQQNTWRLLNSYDSVRVDDVFLKSLDFLSSTRHFGSLKLFPPPPSSGFTWSAAFLTFWSNSPSGESSLNSIFSTLLVCLWHYMTLVAPTVAGTTSKVLWQVLTPNCGRCHREIWLCWVQNKGWFQSSGLIMRLWITSITVNQSRGEMLDFRM